MKPEITVLKNGLRVISQEYPQYETVSLGLWVRTGSAYEAEDLNGISHFLEHMVFKGTDKRSALSISEDIENVGGHTNAYTSREFTAFYAKMLKNDAELALDVLCDMLLNSKFAEEELVKEREVVVQEIKQAIDDPSDIVFDYMQAQAYPNQAMGRPILGTAELVRSFGAKELNGYIGTNYAAENMVACAVGNIKHKDFVKMVEGRMSSLQSKVNFTVDKQVYSGGYFAENRDVEQAQVVLGFGAYGYNSNYYYPAMLLSTVLGGGMSSRLFQEIREKRGLAYSIYSFPSFYSNSGFLGVSTGTDNQEINNMLPVVVDELKKIMNEKVSNDELQRAKAQIKSSTLMALESSSSVSEKLARQILLFGRTISIEETVKHIDEVSVDDIRDIAIKIFTSKPTYALVGKVDDHLEYDKLCDLLK